MMRVILPIVGVIAGIFIIVKAAEAKSIRFILHGFFFLAFFTLLALGLNSEMKMFLYVALVLAGIAFLVLATSVYDVLTTFLSEIFLLALLSPGYPTVVMGVYVVTFFVGCFILCLALWDTANDRTRIHRNSVRFKRIIENTRLSRRKKIVRINGYIALEGLLLAVLSLVGMLFPDSVFGFLWHIQEWPRECPTPAVSDLSALIGLKWPHISS